MADIRESLAAQASLLNELLTGAIEPQIREERLTSAVFELLSSVRAAGGRCTQIEIARRLGITAPSLSEAVRGAVKGGFLEQIADPHDGRAKLLKLTPKGMLSLQRVLHAVTIAERAMLERVSSEDLGVAIDVLKRANLNLARVIQEP
jgi:DNA-binding MarR family transcriptional regulator